MKEDIINNLLKFIIMGIMGLGIWNWELGLSNYYILIIN